MSVEDTFVDFYEVRGLWETVLDIFGRENARAVGGDVDEDLPTAESDGPEEAPREDEPLTEESAPDTDAAAAAAAAAEAAAALPLRRPLALLLQELAQQVLSTPDLAATPPPPFSDAVTADETVHPILLAIGYSPSDDTNFSAPWHFSGTRLPLLRAAKHFLDTKLGQGHSDYSQFSVLMMPEPYEPHLPENPDIDLDLNALIHQVRHERKAPSVDEIKTICYRARELLEAEDNVVCVDPPCTVVGDIHGQFEDLVTRVLENGGDPANTRYVFLGDFVDRGDNSLLCMALILLYKLKYPSNILLLRGNHESRVTNTIYGFHEECRQAFGCHGGLSPELSTLDRLLTFNRFQDIMPQGPMADLTWSDPGVHAGWRVNMRGSGHAFGEDVTVTFCQKNNLDFVCRAHQCVKEGYRWDQADKIVTIFSAPNYCGGQNKGAIMKLSADMTPSFTSYEQAEGTVPLGGGQSLPDYFRSTHDDDDDEDDADDDGPMLPSLAFRGTNDFTGDPSEPTAENRLSESMDSDTDQSLDRGDSSEKTAEAEGEAKPDEADA